MNEALPEAHVWHFLLPDPGMAKYDDKAIKERYPEAIKAINEWRKGFTKKFDKEEITRLERLSHSIDALWQEHANQLAELRASTTDRYAIYGFDDDSAISTSLAFKDEAHDRKLLAIGERNSNAYRRLKLVMDYWCALWFWPIDQYEHLPSREEWLFDLENLLLGDTVGDGPRNASDDLFNESSATAAGSFVDRFGEVVLKRLFQVSPRFGMANKIAELRHFFHWPLEFADIFRERGGFDLVLGNPPWIKVEWEEGGVLGDEEPEFALRNYSAREMSIRRAQEFRKRPLTEKKWQDDYVSNIGLRSYLGAYVNYPELIGVQANLYKCFHPQAWRSMSTLGVNAFLHQEAMLEDPNGGPFRRNLYPRLRMRLQFGNKFPLFRDIGDGKRFGIYVSGNESSKISFIAIANLHHPKTVDDSLSGSDLTEVPGIKRQILHGGKLKSVWDIRGHARRVVKVDETRLQIFSQVYDKEGSSFREARLPLLHAEELFEVISCFYNNPRRLGLLNDSYFSTTMFDETNSQRDGLVEKEVFFPERICDYIVSGPHIYVGNPTYKTPRRFCSDGNHYDCVELSSLPEKYLPRVLFKKAVGADVFRSKIPKVSWLSTSGGETRADEHFRLGFRKRLSQASERTAICALLPKGAVHLIGINSVAFKNNSDLISYFPHKPIRTFWHFHSREILNYSHRSNITRPVTAHAANTPFHSFPAATVPTTA